MASTTAEIKAKIDALIDDSGFDPFQQLMDVNIFDADFTTAETPFLAMAKELINKTSAHWNCFSKYVEKFISLCNMMSSLKVFPPFSVNIIPAPLVDRADNSPIDLDTYSTTYGTVRKDGNVYTVPVTLTAASVPVHENGAGNSGYWVGMGIPADNYVGAACGWWNDSIDVSALTYATDVNDDEYSYDGKNYLTYYFGYSTSNPSRIGYIAYKYEDKYILFKINFNVTIA